MGGCQSNPQKAAGPGFAARLRGAPLLPSDGDHHTPERTCVRRASLEVLAPAPRSPAMFLPHPDRHRLTSPNYCVFVRKSRTRQARSASGAIKQGPGAPADLLPEQLRNALASPAAAHRHASPTFYARPVKIRLLPSLWEGEIIQHEQSNKKKPKRQKKTSQ